MVSEHLVSAFLLLKKRQTVTKIDGIFKGREKEEGERKRERMAGAQGWPDHFFIALGNVCEPLEM